MNGLLLEKSMIYLKGIIRILFTVVAMSIYGMEVGPDASAVKSEGCWIEVSCDSLSLTNEGIFACINGQLFKVNSLQSITEGKYRANLTGYCPNGHTWYDSVGGCMYPECPWFWLG